MGTFSTGSNVMKDGRSGIIGSPELHSLAKSTGLPYNILFYCTSAWCCASGAYALSLWNGYNWATGGETGDVWLKPAPIFDETDNASNIWVPLTFVVPLLLDPEVQEGYEYQFLYSTSNHGNYVTIRYWDAQATRVKVDGVLFNVIMIGRRSAIGLGVGAHGFTAPEVPQTYEQLTDALTGKGGS